MTMTGGNARTNVKVAIFVRMDEPRGLVTQRPAPAASTHAPLGSARRRARIAVPPHRPAQRLRILSVAQTSLVNKILANTDYGSAASTASRLKQAFSLIAKGSFCESL